MQILFSAQRPCPMAHPTLGSTGHVLALCAAGADQRPAAAGNRRPPIAPRDEVALAGPMLAGPMFAGPTKGTGSVIATTNPVSESRKTPTDPFIRPSRLRVYAEELPV